nr:PR domain zinc finger protein 2 isoform X8 [Equus asinus]
MPNINGKASSYVSNAPTVCCFGRRWFEKWQPCLASSRLRGKEAPECSFFRSARPFPPCVSLFQTRKGVAGGESSQNAPEPVAAAETLAEVPDHVLRGLPEEVRLFPSAVDKARIGVWATKPILKGKKFGPFVGDKKKRSQVKNNVYMWEVYYPNLGWMCIDATDPEKGNWLRYVNWACSGEEQNLFPLEINRAIYYKTLKPIAPGEELLVWYNGEDNPEIAAAIEEERASARSKRSSPKSRKATVSAWHPGALHPPPPTSPGSVGMSRPRLQPSSRDPSSKSRRFACSLTAPEVTWNQ